VSILLATFLATNRTMLVGRDVMEIGAGCGLAGLVAARLGPRRCIITDGEDFCLRTIERTATCPPSLSAAAPGVASSSPAAAAVSATTGVSAVGASGPGRETDAARAVGDDSPPAPVEVRNLRWGDPESLEEYLRDGVRPQLVFGADIFHPSFGEPAEVFELVEAVFDPSALHVEFVCGYVDRNNKEQVLAAARARGFSWRDEDPCSFLPEGQRVEDMSVKRLELIVFDKRRA
jgi:hypothetical protein